ncbi:hypothetical protein [Bdellovibrio sp. BCCA]|uniref:hypothetical protein n=1 Tax=Bdellovibrio sp. BCCA TaxID=3136281 RepID=UPI0030F30521
MGKPLMIQLDDDKRIEDLKKKTGAKTKIDVVRAALTLLEHDVKRTEKIQRWQRAAKIVGRSSLDVAKDFQTKDRFKKLP